MTHGTSTQAAVSAIVSALEQEVIFGLRLPKQRIYEDELIARFDTKRHMVRAALQELERKGIVERVPNRGTVVRFFTGRSASAIRVKANFARSGGAAGDDAGRCTVAGFPEAGTARACSRCAGPRSVCDISLQQHVSPNAF